MRCEQRKDVGADGVEGDIAEVEQAGEPDHDVEPPAEHHISEHEDRQVEQIAERQTEMERLLEQIRGRAGKKMANRMPATVKMRA